MADSPKATSRAKDAPSRHDDDVNHVWEPFEPNDEKTGSLQKTDVKVTEGQPDSKLEDDDVVYVKGHPVIRNGNITASRISRIRVCH